MLSKGQTQQLEILPVSSWQNFLLNQADHPECSDELRDRWILCYAFLLKPGIDVRRLRRAVMKLRARHDSLRIRFDRAREGWQAVIDPPGADVLNVVTLGEVDDATFDAELRVLANAPMPLVGSPLAAFTVVRGGRRGDVLILRVHHTIGDGHGMVVLFEDLLRLLMGMPIFGSAVSHRDYIIRFDRPLPSQKAKVDAFWEALHTDFPQTPNIGRKAKGRAPLRDGIGTFEPRVMTFRASEQSLRRSEMRAKSLSITATSMMSAAYLEAMCQCYGTEKIAVLAHAGRTDPALDRFVGDHTLDPVLPYQCAGSAGFDAAAKAFSDMLMRGLAHLPADAARRGSAQFDALYDKGGYPEQFAVYQPRATARQSKSTFSSYFFAGYGQEVGIGPYTMTALDLFDLRERRTFEMQFDLGTEKIRKGFALHYDGLAFDVEEAQKIGNRVCEIMALEPVEVISK